MMMMMITNMIKMTITTHIDDGENCNDNDVDDDNNYNGATHLDETAWAYRVGESLWLCNRKLY